MQVTYGLLEPFSHGRGFQELVSPANPAAGAGLTHKIAGKWASRLIACSFTLTTSSNAADRVVTVQYATAGGTVYGADGAAVAVEANTTAQQFYGTSGRGSSEWNTSTPVFFSLWGGFLYPGFEIIMNVANIDTTDQLASIELFFERFPVGAEGYPIGAMDSSDFQAWREDFAD
jgi:hypothetical protein